MTRPATSTRCTKAEDLVKGLCKKDPPPVVSAGGSTLLVLFYVWIWSVAWVDCVEYSLRLDLWDSSATWV